MLACCLLIHTQCMHIPVQIHATSHLSAAKKAKEDKRKDKEGKRKSKTVLFEAMLDERVAFVHCPWSSDRHVARGLCLCVVQIAWATPLLLHGLSFACCPPSLVLCAISLMPDVPCALCLTHLL